MFSSSNRRLTLLSSCVAIALSLGVTTARAQSLPDVGPIALQPGFVTDVTGMPGFAFSVGDLDGDGLEDVAVPLTADSWEIRGSVSQALLFEVDTVVSVDLLQASLTGTQDLNGDGNRDLVVVDQPPLPDAVPLATLRALDGTTGLDLWSTPAILSLDASGFDTFSSHVEEIGDQNGDGVADLVLRVATTLPPLTPAILFAPSVAVIEVRSGVDGALLHSISAGPPNAATSMTVMGDLDGDGVDDFALGAPGVTLATSGEGVVAIVRGGTFDYLQFIPGVQGGQRFGNAVANIGDLNGDGLNDLAVVSAGSDGPAPQPPGTLGLYEVFSGADFSNLLRRDLATGGSPFPSNIRDGRLVDVTGDGVLDPVFATLLPDGRRLLDGATGVELSFFTRNTGTIADTNGDGIGEIATVQSTGIPNRALVRSILIGAQSYGVSTGSLTARWAPQMATPRNGSLVIESGTPSGGLIIGASLSPNVSATPLPGLLIDLGPSSLIGTFPTALDATGRFAAGLSLNTPSLAGSVVYVQAFDQTSFEFSSGVELLFGF